MIWSQISTFVKVLKGGRVAQGRAGDLKLPDLPLGAVRTFKEHFHALLLRAGAPSIARIHTEIRPFKACGQSTIYNIFASPHIGSRDAVMAVADVLVARLRGADSEAELDRAYALWEAGWLENAGRVSPVAQPARVDVWDQLGNFGPVPPVEPPMVNLVEYVSPKVCAACGVTVFVPEGLKLTGPLCCSTECTGVLTRLADVNTASSPSPDGRVRRSTDRPGDPH
ncbi:hypothetical protein [Streptomyces sp. ISL-86]|uniref:hypothetical protein n=1 Tax=Streptomyces sp. ISL-86 TaxID=2819187 RepID=UPI001BE5EE35|nr:hypothetical protein [Streptomyces sp. ISL-86]MBT2455838.1 hypothetical protein [Streptomyces sp. ISL-86]